MKYFRHAILYVVAVANRLPDHCGDTPINAFLRPSRQRKAPLTLAPFGCRALALKPVGLRKKSDKVQRREECVLLGLASGSKGGYLLLKLSTMQEIVRTDVIFFPDTFPFRDAIESKEVYNAEEEF